MEGRQERVEPLDCAHDVSSSSGEWRQSHGVIAQCNSAYSSCEAIPALDRSRGQCWGTRPRSDLRFSILCEIPQWKGLSRTDSQLWKDDVSPGFR